MIILLQSVTIQFGRRFSHISYDKLRQSNFITKCDRLLLESASGTAKSNRIYYKMLQVLQIVRRSRGSQIKRLVKNIAT